MRGGGWGVGVGLWGSIAAAKEWNRHRRHKSPSRLRICQKCYNLYINLQKLEVVFILLPQNENERKKKKRLKRMPF